MSRKVDSQLGTIADFEALHRGVRSSWFDDRDGSAVTIQQGSEMEAEEIVVMHAGAREIMIRKARKRTIERRSW